MKTPFEFGKIVVGDAFVNRKEELKKLSSNFRNNIHSIMISPRRWGKSSLVKKTSLMMEQENPELRFCFIDLFHVRTEEQFYRLFAKQVIKASSSKVEEWLEDAKNFISRLSPRISIGVDPVNDFEITFDYKAESSEAEEILNLPEKLAVKKGIRMVVCIDEFQNIGIFSDSVAFQKKLRAVWQHQQNVTYCLYGSKRHMMTELFEKRSYPFYKFGTVMNLQRIAKEHFIVFIINAFKNTGKTIAEELATTIVDNVRSHPYYVQQLSHIVWENTVKDADINIVELAMNELIATNSMFYESESESLSNTQINLLKAITLGETQLSSLQVLATYSLGTSANVIKNKRILEKMEILNRDNGNFEFEDPVFECWFKKRFFGQ